ncbi:hypothetical protein [Streptomyces sp. NBC_00344]|uniref:hypothetical protein n=1 Tax=Streptomyces sp. NBC_00344 TaxID=2975720 RepID=UPI002E1D22E8
MIDDQEYTGPALLTTEGEDAHMLSLEAKLTFEGGRCSGVLHGPVDSRSTISLAEHAPVSITLMDEPRAQLDGEVSAFMRVSADVVKMEFRSPASG